MLILIDRRIVDEIESIDKPEKKYSSPLDQLKLLSSNENTKLLKNNLAKPPNSIYFILTWFFLIISKFSYD